MFSRTVVVVLSYRLTSASTQVSHTYFPIRCVQKHVYSVHAYICVMSIWGSLINAEASSAGEIVSLNNEVSLTHSVLQQHEHTERTARLVCQARNIIINPSRHRHHRGIGGARSATCAPGGGEGVDWWPRRRRCHAVAPSASPFFATHQMSARLKLFRPIISILHCWPPFFFLVHYT